MNEREELLAGIERAMALLHGHRLVGMHARCAAVVRELRGMHALLVLLAPSTPKSTSDENVSQLD